MQIRAGADIAFLGGVIRYAIENQRIAKEYLVNFTNAAFIVKEGFKLPEDGLYSGFDEATKTYDRSSPGTMKSHGGGIRPEGAPAPALPANVDFDTTLENPRCVYQLLKKQYSRYTPEMVERITGHPQGSVPEGRRPVHLHPQGRRHEEGRRPSFTRSAGRSTVSARRSSAPRRCCSCCSATSAAPAEASMRLRGHSNIQGATDVAGIFDNLPGYLKVPDAGRQRFRRLDEAHHADVVEAQRMGFVELLVEHAEVRRLAS